jgi:hypothetical protein
MGRYTFCFDLEFHRRKKLYKYSRHSRHSSYTMNL